MYIEMMKTVEEDLNKDLLRVIQLIFSDAISVYESLIDDKKDIFSGDYFKSIKGKLLNFIIYRAFDPKLLTSNLPLKSQITRLPFSQNTPKLVLNNTILTIAKVTNLNSLPAKSKYKLEYAKGNDLIENQFKFDLDGELGVKSLPYYGIITYEYKDYLKSLNILIPDSEFKNIIKTINIPIVYTSEYNGEDNKPILDNDNLKELVLNDIKLKVIE